MNGFPQVQGQTRSNRPVVASATGEKGPPESAVGRLLCRPKKQDTVRCEQTVHTRQERSSSFLRDVKQHIPQENQVETLPKRHRWLEQVGLLKVAQLADLWPRNPVFLSLIEITNNPAGRQPRFRSMR